MKISDMRTFTILSTSLLLWATAVSCSRDAESISPSGEMNMVRIAVGGCSFDGATKSVFGKDAAELHDFENRISGFVLALYDSDGNLIAPAHSVTDCSGSTVVPVRFPKGSSVHAYVLMNMWSGPNLIEAPNTEAQMLSLAFKLGSGSNMDFSDMARTGIPASGHLAISDSDSGHDVTIACTRMLARVNVTIGHSGYTGMDTGSSSLFRNSSLYLRQVNCNLKPFADMAASAGDIAAGETDYDATMVRATDNTVTYTYYVPENLQGNVEGVTGNGRIPSRLGSRGGLVSYIQFNGSVDAGSNGLSGDITYRMCLGENTLTNFDIVRNRVYNISMSFSTGSLFDRPVWRMDGEIEDSRLFAVTKTGAAGPSAALSGEDGDFVAVRCNRPGKVYLYLNPEGNWSSVNAAGPLVDWPCSPVSLDDKSWYEYSSSSANNFSALSSCGISASYDESSHLLTFTVTDPSRFRTGRTITLNCHLAVGDISRQIVVKTVEDIALDISDAAGFYVGMRRDMAIRGYTSSVSVRNSATGLNSIKYSFDGGATRNYLNSSAVPVPGWTVPLYAYYENDVSHACTVTVVPEDLFNDDELSLVISAKRPHLSMNVTESLLYVHGDEVPVDLAYSRDEDGADVIRYTDFDASAFEELLQPAGNVRFSCVAEGGGSSPFGPSDFGLDFIGENSFGYPLLNVFVERIPAAYVSTTRYQATMRCSIPYDSRSCDDVVFEIPAFDKSPKTVKSRTVEDCTMLASLNSSYSESVSTTLGMDSKVSFGVRNSADVETDVQPQSLNSVANGCISVRKICRDGPGCNDAYVECLLEDRDSRRSRKTHSAGVHNVRFYTRNKHSGDLAYSHHDLTLKVFVHMVAGTQLDLFDLDPSARTVTWDYWGVFVTDVDKTSLGGNHEMTWPVHIKSTQPTGTNFTNYGVQRLSETSLGMIGRSVFQATGGHTYANLQNRSYITSNWRSNTVLCDENGVESSTLHVRILDLYDRATNVGYHVVHHIKDLDSSSGGWVAEEYQPQH